MVGLWEMPATKMAMEAALEHPDLAEAFVKRYAPQGLLRVHVKLEERRQSRQLRCEPVQIQTLETGSAGRRPLVPVNPSRPARCARPRSWSTRRKLIQLILPWTRKALGTD